MPARKHFLGLTLLLTVIAAAIPTCFYPALPLAHAGAKVQKRENILVLHSYSQDFVWTRSQQEGIEAVFEPLASAYDVRIEYLDAVHHPELLKGTLLLDLLRVKLKDQQFKMVLTSDNAAFNFARTHRADLFPGVPIVFMGVNGYEDSMLRGEQGITGVAEDSDLAGTLRVLLNLMPQTKRIIFPGMTDDITYRAIRTTVAKDLQALPSGIKTEFPEYPDVDAALDALRALPQDAAIVIMTNMRTRNGDGISSQRVVELVSAAAPVPVFTNWDFTVGHGAVGGSVISGVEQGRQAAEIAVRVLRGELAESIPVRRGAGRTFLFDYRQLTRFGIPASRLPAEAVVRFAPERLLQISRETAWAIGISFALLLGVTGSLVFAVRRRRRAEEQVRAINQQLESSNSALATEIAEHKLAEKKLSRLNRELRAISDCNQALIKAEDEQTLLNEVCRIICDEAGYRMAWVGYPDNDEAKTVRPVAWAGIEEGYLPSARLTWADTERGRGPSGTSIRTGRSCMFQDFATDPLAAPWRENALERGYRSCISLPLKDGKADVFGVLVIYAAEPNAFTTDEIRLMEELAGDLAFGIRSLRNRSARQKAEEKILETNERFRSVLRAGMAYSIIGTDQDGIIRVFNVGAELMLGYGAEEVVDKATPLLIHDPDEVAARAAEIGIAPGFEVFVAAARKGETETREWTYIRKDRTRIDVSLTVTAMRDEAGEMSGFIGVAQDITERKRDEEKLHLQAVALEQEVAERQQAQEELQSLNNELEQRVKDRTIELSDKNQELQKAYDDLKVAQARLLQQDKMASIGQLAAGVAHEINNPMGFIISNLSSLGRYTEKMSAYIESGDQLVAGAAPEIEDALARQRSTLKIDRIRQDLPDLIRESLDGAERVRKIVQDLKSFSRLDSAELVLADLNEGLESTLAIVWNELKYKATVTKEYGELPRINCNPGQLNQVFMNLLVNAVQAIESKGDIRIRTWVEGDRAMIAIADTGCGIPEETRGHIFDPFFTTKEVGKGTGLGLAIAYDIIVNKHGGSIEVESEAGKGSTFVISLPVGGAEIVPSMGRAEPAQ